VTWHAHDDDRSHDHSAPADDHLVIYLDGSVMMFVAADHGIAAHSVVAWVAPPLECPCVTPADVAARAGADRPPGDRAATIHDLLPHVLRI
jgi:hypothetical protein